MWINGWDPENDGWDVTGLSGWMSGPAIQRGSTAIPNIAGVLPNTQYATETRVIAVTLEKNLTAITDRDASLYTLQDRLRGKLWVRFDDAPNRVVRCVASATSVEPMEEITVFSVAAIRVRFTFICYDGFSYDSEPRILALATTPVEVPMGTAPSVITVMWGGAWSATTSRTITYRDTGGVARSVGTFTAPSGKSLGSTDHLVIDSGKGYVTKVASDGTRTASEDWGDDSVGLPVGSLDPALQDRANSRYGTLEISAGTAQIIYRKAYWL